jgi:tetratricopeptide (TPR) repeat protein
MEWLQFRLQLREAQDLLGIPVEDDPRLVLLRARALAGLRRAHDAFGEYQRAIKLAPNDPLIRLEAHRNSGFYRVTRGRYSLAAEEYAKAKELAPNDSNLWYFQAIAQLASGKLDAYRNTCQDMIRQFINTTSAMDASSVIMVCICRPDVIEDWQPLLPLTELASTYVSDSPRLLAAAQYRAGDYQAAVDTYQRVAHLHRLRAFDLFFLAMSHQRLGQQEQAEQRLREAEDWIKEANRSAQSKVSPFVEQATWGSWTERPETSELRREAVALIRP